MAKEKAPASPPPSRGELATLLNGAKELPGDLTPRLVLADWLEEHGDPERAEFVRIQSRRVPAKKEELGRREEELLALHANEWLAPFRQAADRSDARLLQRVPRTVQRYLRWRFESGLLRLAIDPESFVHPAVEALAGTEAWAWVEVMLPRGVQGDLGGRLRNSPLWAGLFGVDFEDCKLGPEGAKALAAVKTFTCLHHLDVGHNALKASGAAALVKAPWLLNLRSIDMAHNGMGDEGAIAVARSPQVAKLHTLDLRDNRIGDAGAAALATSPHLANLAELDLGRNRIGDTGAKALATGVFKTTLRFGIYSNPMTAQGAALLRERFGANVFGLE